MLKWLLENLEISETITPGLLVNRALYKWILDVLRNLLMVTALTYVATKSGSPLVWALVIVAVVALGGYCHTYADMVGTKRDMQVTWRNMAASFLVTLVVQAMMLGVTVGMYVAIDRMVKAQMIEMKK